MSWATLEPAVRNQAIGSLEMMAKYLNQGTLAGLLGAGANATWPVANRAIYLPFELDRPMAVNKLWVYNGSAGSTGNWDIGIYTADGRQLVHSGSIAQSGVGVPQTVSVSLELGRGVHYIGLVADSASTSIFRVNSGAANDWLLWGALQQAAAFPLPDPATFASNQNQFLPFCGLTGRLL